MAAQRITLPGTNLNVSRICLGCWQFNGGKDTVNWGAQTPEVSRYVTRYLFKMHFRQVKLFDTTWGTIRGRYVLLTTDLVELEVYPF